MNASCHQIPVLLLGSSNFEMHVHPPPAVFDFGTFCRVLVILLSLKHASDDEAVSFQHISNWHDACMSNCENAGEKTPRIRSDSSGDHVRQGSRDIQLTWERASCFMGGNCPSPSGRRRELTSPISETNGSTQKRLRVRVDETVFGCFMMEPSPTADVEATLVHGAQGTCSLNLFFLRPVQSAVRT
jgi:hypothetical protein